MMFNQTRELTEKIGDIYMLEGSLYSDDLAIAGRVDCIAEFDGKLSIIDFKTSSKEKKEEWIEGYLVQETGYAKMYEERSGIKVEQIVTLITCQTGDTQVFVKNPDDYVPLLKDYIREYKNAQ